MLAAAVDVARAAVEDHVSADLVGDHEGVTVEGDRLLTHHFASLQPGYRGWHWAVTLARPPRGRTATVCEVSLVPGEGALIAPEWVPWEQRLEPADVSGTDILPYESADVRLVAGHTDTTEDADRLEIDELGLGRRRVLSREGIDMALTRWYEGAGGPTTPGAIAAQAHCGSCGFFVKLSGTPRRMFGVCANEWSADDGRVVSVDHGCGSHSETDVAPRSPLWNPPSMVLDESELEVVRHARPAESAQPEDGDGEAGEAAEEAAEAAGEATEATSDEQTPKRGRSSASGTSGKRSARSGDAAGTEAGTAAADAAADPEPWQDDAYVKETGTVAVVAGVAGGPGDAGGPSEADGPSAAEDAPSDTATPETDAPDAKKGQKRTRRATSGGRTSRSRKKSEAPESTEAPGAQTDAGTSPAPWQSDEYVKLTGTVAVVTGAPGV